MTTVRFLPLQGRGRGLFLTAFVLAMLAGFIVSSMLFLADRYAAAADRILDNPLTEEKDVADITEESLPAYREAISALETARILAPLRSAYAKALADLYSRINVWQGTMQTMGIALPDGLSKGNALRDAAFRNARRAVELDPANADHLLTLGQLYATEGMRYDAVEQLNKAINAYPINGSIRYAAAMQMLMMGFNEQAREQARLLAWIDDGYRLDEDPSSRLSRERRTAGYEAYLAKSYLYKAMEITWRTTSRDANAVLAVVPDNDDAREVARIFFEQKGMDTGMFQTPVRER